MKKKNRKRWTKYTKPVVLHKDRTPLGDLYVTCHYYERVRSTEHRNLMAFKFNRARADHIHVQEIICPVNMTYHQTSELYTLNMESVHILRTQSNGQTTWDPTD